MADITCTAAKVAVVFPEKAIIDNGIAAAALTAGQPVYIDSNGKYGVADANGSGTTQFRGIVLESVGAGQPCSVLVSGELYGYTLSGAYDSLAYVSDTAGSLSTTAGTTSLAVGRVVAVFDSKQATKILKVTGWAG